MIRRETSGCFTGAPPSSVAIRLPKDHSGTGRHSLRSPDHTVVGAADRDYANAPSKFANYRPRTGRTLVFAPSAAKLQRDPGQTQGHHGDLGREQAEVVGRR